ncbi:hypothetical protein [Enterovibrio norvegicus]|uniref:hypothetical protein n=1 Tax=Enterovibrio norvegicus TaxID=188144 RepID=UPI000C84DA48|nr:hypothetical protein [Enterovibrio norvegicus]PMH72327.1 hypothetical protein BCU62_23110 [Enterovibrio norvegicus]
MKLWGWGCLLFLVGCANTDNNVRSNNIEKSYTHDNVCSEWEKEPRNPRNILPRKLAAGLTAKRLDIINDDFSCHINMVIEIDDDLLIYPDMEGNNRAEKVEAFNSPKGQLTLFDGLHPGMLENIIEGKKHWNDVERFKFSFQIDFTSGDTNTVVINTLDNTGFAAGDSCYSKFIAIDLCAYAEEEALLTQKKDLYKIQDTVILDKVSSAGKVLTLEYAYLPEFDYVLDGTNVQRQKIRAAGLKTLEREMCGKPAAKRGFVKAGGEVRMILKTTNNQLTYSTNALTCASH